MTSRRGIALAAATLCLILAVVVARFPENPVTRHAQSYAAGVAATAAGTYVTLRTLNAVLSTAQELEVGMSFIASGTAQPLKWLEPLDDTVERIAALVFGVMVATAIIAVALGPTSAIGLGMLGVAIGVWALRGKPLSGITHRFVWYGAFLGLALPLALSFSAPLAEVLTHTTLETNAAVVAEITAGVGGSDITTEGIDDDLKMSEYRSIASNVWTRADDLIGALVAIFGVYVFRIFILPVLMIVGLFLAVRSMARTR